MTPKALEDLQPRVAARRFPFVVVQATDYRYQGHVVAIIRKLRGAIRCVVEDDCGRLFIHNASQIEGEVVK